MKDTPSAQTLNNTGACAVVNGPSGSGKSLFLRMIADLDPNEGKVFLGDLPRASMPATRWRRNVVYVAAQSRARIPEFESSQPSQAVQSPRCDLRVCENS